jgi:tRNA-modifying protein YgfZ
MSDQFLAPNHQLITFDGIDAKNFLQSQLTNDVAELVIGGWQWQGYCNAKGRLHATFALARLDENLYAAVVHSSVCEFLVKRLTMFRLRAKVLIERTDRFALVFHLAEPTQQLTRPGVRLALGHERWIDIDAETLRQTPSATQEMLDAWELRGIEAMQPEVVAATNERFVPQMLGMDRLMPAPGVSFSKGCYPGQEVVARAHYRGAVKREPALLRVPLEPAIEPGIEIAQSSGEPAEIVNCVVIGHEWRALAVVPIHLT